MKKAIVILIVIIACVIAINRLCVDREPDPFAKRERPTALPSPTVAATAAAQAQTLVTTATPDPVMTPSPTSSIPAQMPFSAPHQVHTPTPEKRQRLGASQRQIDDFEGASLLRTLDPSVYDSIGELPWVADGIYRIEWEPLQGLIYLALEAPLAAETLMEVRWMTDELDENEGAAVSALGYLVWHRVAFDARSPIERILSLPWFTDGINEDEAWALYSLPDLANESPQLVRDLVSKPWFSDGITEDESFAIQSLGSISYETDAVSMFLAMPFLDSIEPPDSHALLSLSFLSEETPAVFDDIISHPTVADGITDAAAPVIALLYDIQFTKPELIDTLLDPSGVMVEERDIELPLAGGVRLAIVRTQAGASRSIDLLESAVRFSERHMDEPFPTTFALLLFADAVLPDADGHNAGINMVVHPDFDVDDGSEEALLAPSLVAHEVAHYYWNGFGEDWIYEGAAELMAFVYDEAIAGYEWRVSDLPEIYPCPISDLTALERHPGELPIDCVYGLGGGLFLDLYRTLGDEDFRKGFRALYLMNQQQDVDFGGPRAQRAHVRQAFEFDPVARDEIIPKWYGE